MVLDPPLWSIAPDKGSLSLLRARALSLSFALSLSLSLSLTHTQFFSLSLLLYPPSTGKGTQACSVPNGKRRSEYLRPFTAEK